MKQWLAEVVSVGGMTGTREECIDHLVANNGWTLNEAVRIVCYAKAHL